MTPRPTRFVLITAALVAAVTAMPAAYVLTGPKWGTRTVNYYINPANADVPEAAAESAIQTGAATWGSQSAADFRFYYMGRTSGTSLANNGKNEVFFRNTSNGGVIAETYWWGDSSGHLVDADIVFYDGGFTFFTGSSGCSAGIYIEDTAAHEFGHVLGLGHSADPDATMYYMQSWCSTNGRTLNNDDLAGVEALYPPNSAPVNTAPSVSITSPGTGATFVAGTAFTLSGSASDQQDGNLSGAIAWTSSLSGPLGVGASLAATLPAGTHTITAGVTDSGGLKTTTQTVVTIAAAAPPAPSVIVLSGTAVTAKNGARTDLRWSGSVAAKVDVYRNGSRVLSATANDGTQSDSLGRKASGTYTYKLCDAGTSTCSNSINVVF